uniref:Major facilitator superfamily (MFS) profile domain-containing protein n=1 Tax=Strigamia maritima TaxID=126957 RepID=T1IKN2_STRMM
FWFNKPKCHFFLAVAVCVLGSGFQHGFHTGVVNTSQNVLETFINRTQVQRNGAGFSHGQMSVLWASVVSIYCLGATVGSFFISYVAETFGRKRALSANNVILVLGVALTCFSYYAKSYELIIIGRFVIGINTGLNAGLAPIYLTEIAPKSIRGATGSTYQLIVTVAILLSEGLAHPSVLGTSNYWPFLFALTAVPAVLQSVGLYFCPETPYFVYKKTKDKQQVEEVLTWLRQVPNVQDEVNLIQTEVDTLNKSKLTIQEAMNEKVFRQLLVIGIEIVLARQLCGIHVVIYYSTDLFVLAGLTTSAAVLSTLGVSTVQVIVTGFSLWLVERFGRRPVFLLGIFFLTIVCLLLTTCLVLQHDHPYLGHVSVFLVLLFIMIYSLGVSSIPWFIVSELFDPGARSLANSIATSVNWFVNFVLVLVHLPLEQVMGGYVLVINVVCLVPLLFALRSMPETKDRTPSQIKSLLAF